MAPKKNDKPAKKSAAKQAKKNDKPAAAKKPRVTAADIEKKRDELVAFMKTVGGPIAPSVIREKLAVGSAQMHKVLADSRFEKVGTVGPKVAYKLAA